MFPKIKLCALHSAGSLAACADMQLLASSIPLAFYVLNVGFPNSVGSSMRMADVVTEVSALTTNITFSHFRTS